MSLSLWKDQELSRLRRDMERLFEAFCEDFTTSCTMEQFMGPPSVDLVETEEELVIRADVPGLDVQGLHLFIEDDVLVIHGTREQRAAHEGGDLFQSTSFTRHVPLPVPVQVDQATATFKDGRLTVRLPRIKAAPPRRIAVSVESSQNKQLS